MKKKSGRMEHKYRMQDDGSLAYLFFHTVRRIKQMNYAGYSQQRVLNILGERESMNQKELQEILEIQPGSMSELLAKLEDKGLIERSRDEKDRRNVIVKITESGKGLIAEISLKKDKMLFGALSEEEREQFRNILNKLAAQASDTQPADFVENIQKEGNR